MIFVVLAIFVLTYALLIFRKIIGRTIPIWGSMALGAILMVATLSISPIKAFDAINFQIIAFLFGILVITAGFEKSGVIEYLILSVFKRSRNFDLLLLGLLFGAGLLSAFLVNDGVALLLTPLALGISTRLGVSTKSLLIPVAFGITTGSAFSPIGNPQNLLVALNSGMSSPFARFVGFLLIPSLVSLLAIFGLSKIFFKSDYNSVRNYSQIKVSLQDPSEAISDPALARLCVVTLVLMIISFMAIEIFPTMQSHGVTYGTVASFFGIIILVLSPRRPYLLAELNWGILIFFAGMFVIMAAVWDSNVGSALLSIFPKPDVAFPVESIGAIMFNSVFLSQVLSNVPFAQLYSYEMHALLFSSSSTREWLSLASGSTLAGNLTLLGAVSNVIILHSAEARGSKAFSFFEFLKYGSVITLVTVAIFFVFLIVL